MKRLIVGTVGAVVVALGLAPQASAYWATRVSYRWDPVCGRYIAHSRRVWIPDCAPPPVIVRYPYHVERHLYEDRFVPVPPVYAPYR